MAIRLEFSHMKLETQGKLAWLTFTREAVLNAMNNEATVEINRMALALQQEPDVRVVVIRGQGRSFSTGIDLKELAAGQIDMTYHERWEKALRLFEAMEKIVIAGMHGYCLGGALQLALACDIRVSTENCQIGLPAVKESLIPGLSTWRLPKYIGWGRAKKLVLGGKNIDGAEALRIGLVDHVVPEAGFRDHLDAVARDYLATCSTGMRLTKQLLGQAFEKDYDSILERYFELQKRAQYSPDAKEASRAYLAGETPQWQ
jgi:enoyl-CoA hydratase/carnithine racemase